MTPKPPSLCAYPLSCPYLLHGVHVELSSGAVKLSGGVRIVCIIHGGWSLQSVKSPTGMYNHMAHRYLLRDRVGKTYLEKKNIYFFSDMLFSNQTTNDTLFYELNPIKFWTNTIKVPGIYKTFFCINFLNFNLLRFVYFGHYCPCFNRIYDVLAEKSQTCEKYISLLNHHPK